MSDSFMGISWTFWGGVCLVVAAIQMVIWPRPKENTRPRPLWRHLILRWAHGLVWLLLALSCFMRPGSLAASANSVAMAGLLVYVAYLATLAIDRKMTTS